MTKCIEQDDFLDLADREAALTAQLAEIPRDDPFDKAADVILARRSVRARMQHMVAEIAPALDHGDA